MSNTNNQPSVTGADDSRPADLVNSLIAGNTLWDRPETISWSGAMWCGRQQTSLSYPPDGQIAADAAEPGWWFEARAELIAAYIARSRIEGSVWDIGGGNGTMAHCLAELGCPPVVVVEPMRASAERAIPRSPAVFACTLDELGLPAESLPAAMLLDVIEHLRDPESLLRHLEPLIVDGGLLIVTVPAHKSLWSDVDVAGGHYRRYSRKLLRATLERGGFRITAMRYIFSSLYVPALVARRLQSAFSRQSALAADRRRLHPNPFVEQGLRRITSLENRIPDPVAIPFGTSLIAVAQPQRKPGS